VRGLLGAFFAQVAIITYRSVSGKVKVPTDAPLPLPLPASYTAAGLVYGALAVLPTSLAPVASLLGWGFVVANLFNLWPVAKPAAAATPVVSAKAPVKATS
jgi:hypothetical protein